MTEIQRPRLPVVRRVSHEKLLNSVKDDHAREIDALKAQLETATAEIARLGVSEREYLYQIEQLQALEREAAQAAHEQLTAIEQRNRDLEAECARLGEAEADRIAQFDALNTECARLSEAESERNVQFDALKAERDQWREQTSAYKAECERLSAAESERSVQFDALKAECDQWREQTSAYKAECERLSAAESERSVQFDALKAECDQWRGQTSAYKAECERLGEQTIRLEIEKVTSTSQFEAAEKKLALLNARDPLFIGTFPRSGTWMLKYFLVFLDHYCRSTDAPQITDIYERATADNHYALNFDALGARAQRISISHWMCPGVFDLPSANTDAFFSLIRQLNCFDFQRETNEEFEIFHPDSKKPRILFIYRNPFDVYRSYADIYERRVVMKDRRAYPFNPMTPFGTDLMNSDCEADEAFEHFISGMLESGFPEFFAAYFMSFLLVQDAYPERVHILRYEDAMADRQTYLRQVADYGRLGDVSETPFAAAFDAAFEATDITEMKKYEAKLGHAISGKTTFYGEANATHLSVRKRNWREIFSQADQKKFADRMRAYEPRILDFLPELIPQIAT